MDKWETKTQKNLFPMKLNALQMYKLLEEKSIWLKLMDAQNPRLQSCIGSLMTG